MNSNHHAKPNMATFRFYEELNDFLPPEKFKKRFDYRFNNTPSIKDAIEAIGVPHTEVDLIIVNGHSVGFDYLLQNADSVSVYPTFEAFDIRKITKLREKPLRELTFVLDVHLGKLARLMRMCGFDCVYENHLEDNVIIEISCEQGRVILTRDRGILKNKKVTHGYFIRATDPNAQLIEVVHRFDLKKNINPFTRCLECNTILVEIEKEKIVDRLDDETRSVFNTFLYCNKCDKIYWRGSHYEEMLKKVNALVSSLE